MATTIKSSSLKLSIQESILLDGVQQGSTTTKIISGINNVFKRLVTCTASQTTTVMTFNATVHGAAGAIDLQDAKYIRITNKDDTNALELAVVGAATLYQVELAAGESHILGNPEALMLAEADTSPSFGTMADLASIQVNPGGNAITVEVFVASAV